MADDQIVEIACPHCDHSRSINVDAMREVLLKAEVRDTKKRLRGHKRGRKRRRRDARKTRTMRDTAQREDAEAWVEVVCPHCERVYRYNAHTHEVKVAESIA